MTNYLIRTGKDGMVTDLVELGEEDMSDECDGCDQLEAAMLAIISSLREEIGMLKARVSELEKKPLVAEPLRDIPDNAFPAFDHLTRPWTITYTDRT